jgi:cell division septal protein FtsQ
MSFFSTSNSNRRIKRGGPKRQQSLLEVAANPEKEQRRPSARKMGGAFKGTLLAILVIGLVGGSRILIQKLIWENPAYALDDIRVTTDGLLTRAQVLEIMEIQDGKNIFTVDLAKARKALDLMPQVEHVDIRRVLPSRIDVRIAERQPIAWVAPASDTELGVDGKAFLVDTRGYVMRTRKVMPEHLALPRITGVVMEDVAPGQKLPTAEAFSAVELIKLSAEDIRWQPRVVDVSKGYCLLVTDHRRAKVTFSFDNIEGQLARLRQIMDYIEPTQREFQSVNLMLERSVPIVFAPPPAPVVPAQETKPAKGKAGGKNAGGPSVSGGLAVSGGQSVPASAFAPPKAVAVTPAGSSNDAPNVAAPRGANPASISVATAPLGAGPAPSSSAPAPLSAPAPARRSSPEPKAAAVSGASASPAAPKSAPSEPPSALKLARISPSSPTPPPSEKPDPRMVEKIKAELKSEPKVEKLKLRSTVAPEKEDVPVRPKKQPVNAAPASKNEKKPEKEEDESKSDKVKPSGASPGKTKPKNSFESEPSSLPPDETLRKLFNPHG